MGGLWQPHGRRCVTGFGWKTNYLCELSAPKPSLSLNTSDLSWPLIRDEVLWRYCAKQVRLVTTFEGQKASVLAYLVSPDWSH